jgi:THAP4-like, heme-binding beta-barrel domain
VSAPALHPDAEPLAFLLGTWRGEGHGHYPTIEPFDYVEEITFGHVGKPWLAYQQRTRHATEDRPLHAESGYLRPVGLGRLEVVMAYPTGHVEVADGTIDGTGIDWKTRTLVATGTAKRVDEVKRTLRVDGDLLSYEMAMAAVGVPLTPHLSATLRRV